MSNGFEEIIQPTSQRIIFRKKITPSEIDQVFDYSTYWLYKGYRVMVKNNDDWFNDALTECQVVTDWQELVQSEGFVMFMDRDYIGTVPKSALEIVETKTPAPNYFNL